MRHRHDAKTSLLLALPALSAGGPRQARALAEAGDVVDVAEGTVLLDAGRRPRQVHLLLAGVVEAVADGGVVARFGPGDLVGLAEELGAVPAVADAVVAEPVRALVLTGPRLRALVATNEVLRGLVLRQLAREAHGAAGQLVAA